MVPGYGGPQTGMQACKLGVSSCRNIIIGKASLEEEGITGPIDNPSLYSYISTRRPCQTAGPPKVLYHWVPSTYLGAQGMASPRPLIPHAMIEGTFTHPILPAPRSRPAAHMRTSKGIPLTTCGALPCIASSTFLATPAACKQKTCQITIFPRRARIRRNGEEHSPAYP